MQDLQKTPGRKKFLVWAAMVLSSIAVLKLIPAAKQKKNDTVKMLTEDGTLVEIDRDKIPGTKRKNITDPELKAWVKNKNTQP